MTENVLPQGKILGIARFVCLVFGVASVLGCYWGVGILLGPIAFLLANWLNSKEGHTSTDIGGIAALVGFGLSLAIGVPRFGDSLERETTWIGREAPDFELVDIEGETQRLSDHLGKRVFVLHWGIKCPPCVREIPLLISLVEELPKEDFQILSVSSDPEFWLKKAVEKTGINYPVVSLSSVGNDWGEPYSLVQILPTLLVVSPRGRFEEIHVGGLSQEELTNLAKGEFGS